MWCRLSHSGHSTIKDVCPVLYSYCLHCGWAFHSAGKGVDTVILLDLRTPPVELKPWQLLPGSFCQVPSQNVNTPRWINKGEIIFFFKSVALNEGCVHLMCLGYLDGGGREKRTWRLLKTCCSIYMLYCHPVQAFRWLKQFHKNRPLD